ncbi:hypothetical protein DWU95_09985, partial [Burkholderia contaminans]
MIKQALISVSDKTGIVDFAKSLSDLGVKLLSTGGTAKLLADAGLPVTEVADYTGFPEMLDGRVKTLHPKVHGGILARRDLPEHMQALEQHGIPTIDLLVVNLYPFVATIAKDDCTLADAIVGADVFLGCSSAGVLKQDMVKTMGDKPLILALANPEPEIRPEDAKAVRPDAIVATGRSDYPNQVNNVLCFPFIFRGALDVGATTITEEMKLACVRAIAELAQETDQSEEVAKAYEGHSLEFGPDYLIPKPFDPRLIIKIAPAVAQAAMDSGVATRPIQDMDAYREQLGATVYRTGMVMRPVFATAKQKQARIVFAEGEDERVLRGAQ